MKSFLDEFKAFAMRGNVVDLAVAVVIGGAFGKIVSSLVDNIVMPLIGLILGGIDFSELSVNVGDAVVGYGSFIQSMVDFTIIAFVIFMAIKMLNAMKDDEPEKEDVPKGPTEVELLAEIRDQLKRGQ